MLTRTPVIVVNNSIIFRRTGNETDIVDMSNRRFIVSVILLLAFALVLCMIREAGMLSVSPRESLRAAQDATLCSWTVIAGDSNNREMYYKWVGLEKGSKEKLVLEAVREGNITLPEETVVPNQDAIDEGALAGISCSPTDVERYEDHEIVVINESSNTSSCHIISHKFFNHQQEIRRLVKRGMMHSDFCGTSLSDPLMSDVVANNYRRPPFPNTLWFSHGLWNLPNNGGQHSKGLNCTTRFQAVVDAINTWRATTNMTKIVWQTLFRVHYHPTISNDYLDWDVTCQKETAAQLNIEVFDLHQKMMSQRFNGCWKDDYHLTNKNSRYVLRKIRETCCGLKREGRPQ